MPQAGLEIKFEKGRISASDVYIWKFKLVPKYPSFLPPGRSYLIPIHTKLAFKLSPSFIPQATFRGNMVQFDDILLQKAV